MSVDTDFGREAGSDGAQKLWPAFLVHVFTASGAGLALLAMMAASERRWPLMFAWLGLALAVDGLDGAFARRLDVARRVPRWSGDILDLVVDILTYVFVPAYALVAGGVLPDALALPLGVLIVVTGVLYFADQRMKTADNYFRGFPAVWNAVAFYLFVVPVPPFLAAAVVVLLAALTFVPVPFLHPFRVRRLRVLNAALLVLWALLAAVALATAPPTGPWIVVGLCVIGAYFLLAGLLRRRPPHAS